MYIYAHTHTYILTCSPIETTFCSIISCLYCEVRVYMCVFILVCMRVCTQFVDHGLRGN